MRQTIQSRKHVGMVSIVAHQHGSGIIGMRDDICVLLV